MANPSNFSVRRFVIWSMLLPLFVIHAQNFTRITTGPVVTDIGESRGCSWADIDNDGDLDLFAANYNLNNSLYVNNGDGTFSKVTQGSVVNDLAYSYGGSFADSDNDGDLDLFVVNFNGQNNFFYLNNGDGTFTKVTTGILVNDGGFSRDCCWGDYNNDGYVDLFVVNNGYDFLYKNNGNNDFTKVLDGPVVNNYANSVGCSFADYDNDGDLDIFVANGFGENNFLYQNNGDETFTQILSGEIVNDGGNSESASWADYDNDGDLDLYVTNKDFQNNFLYINNGNDTFTKVTDNIIVSEGGDSRASSWGDYDNDGDLDLIVANMNGLNFLYSNNGNGSFTKITSGSIATDIGNSIGAIWSDYNNDGQLDLFVSNGLAETNFLYLNNGNTNNWINIKCSSNTFSNSSAVGTKIRLKGNINGTDVWQFQEILNQRGVRCQNSINAEFGLGDAIIIDSLVVEWPSSQIFQTFTDFPVNQFLEIMEPFQNNPNPQMFIQPLLLTDTVFVGYTKTRTLYIANTRLTPSYLFYAITENPEVDWLDIIPDSGQVRNRQTDTINVILDATNLNTGNYLTALIISGNDTLNSQDTVDVYLHISEAPLAVITPNFQNPVFVQLGDSVDVSINLANAGGSNLLWSASTTWQPMVLENKVQLPIFGPREPLLYAKTAPVVGNQSRISIEAIWDLQFSFDVQAASGAPGNYGSEFDGTYYYTTRWASNLLHKYEMTGALVEEFSIPGVSYLLDLAFDGIYMYGGAETNTIYIMDFNTKTLIGTIPSPVPVLNIAYDRVNDGFWVADWSTDLVLVNRNGVTLASIPATTHGLFGMGGSAYDDWTDGGPYLWVFDQGMGQGYPQFIHQINLTSGVPSGVSHDVTLEFPASVGIAGGLFTTEGIVPGKVSISGVLQGTPDMFFVYELTEGGPTWMKMMMTAGMVAPGDNSDMPMRIYGMEEGSDTAFVVIQTNDPVAPVINIEVHKTMVTGLEDLTQMPTTFDMSQNYPNPFNPTTTIKYQLPQLSDVSLVIYNVLGQQVRTLLKGQLKAGYHSVVWDGRNEAGLSVASGIYIYRFEAGEFLKSRKLLILR